MTPAERQFTLASYETGDVMVLVNVAVLTEGYDYTPTSCIVLLRPSSYKSTLIQMVGRGHDDFGLKRDHILGSE